MKTDFGNKGEVLQERFCQKNKTGRTAGADPRHKVILTELRNGMTEYPTKYPVSYQPRGLKNFGYIYV